MVTFEGVSSTRVVQPREKFRATWARDRAATVKTIASLGVLTYDAVLAAQAVVHNMPTRGAYVASAPAVSPGDETFVLDLRISTSWKGTAGALANMLNELTPSYDLVKLKAVDLAESAAAGERDRAREQERAEEAHDDSDLGSTIEKQLKKLILYAALAGGAFLVVTNLPTLYAAGKVAKRLAK